MKNARVHHASRQLGGRLAVLVNPAADAANAESQVRDLEAAARTKGVQIQVFNASTSREIEAAFAALARLAARARDPGSRIGVLEMSPAASNAANFDLPIGVSHRPRDERVV